MLNKQMRQETVSQSFHTNELRWNSNICQPWIMRGVLWTLTSCKLSTGRSKSCPYKALRWPRVNVPLPARSPRDQPIFILQPPLGRSGQNENSPSGPLKTSAPAPWPARILLFSNSFSPVLLLGFSCSPILLLQNKFLDSPFTGHEKTATELRFL